MRKNPLQVITSANGIFDDSSFASIAVHIEKEKQWMNLLFQLLTLSGYNVKGMLELI